MAFQRLARTPDSAAEDVPSAVQRSKGDLESIQSGAVKVFSSMQVRWLLKLGLRFSSHKNLKEATIHAGAGLDASGLEMRKVLTILVSDARLADFFIPADFQAVLARIGCWVRPEELEFVPLQDLLDKDGFGPSKSDNLLRPVLATCRDRMLMKAPLLVARKQGGRARKPVAPVRPLVWGP
jgi:hypothetical protein